MRLPCCVAGDPTRHGCWAGIESVMLITKRVEVVPKEMSEGDANGRRWGYLAEVRKEDGGQVRPVLAHRGIKRARGPRGPEPAAPDLADRSPEILVGFNVAALVLTNANSYLWNTLWTFRHRARHDAKQVGLFTAQGVLNVAVGGLLLWLLAHWLVAHTNLSPLAGGNLAKIVSMAGASTLSFVFLRFFVFRKTQ